MKRIVVACMFVLLVAWGIGRMFAASPFLSKQDRITVGVYSAYPFVITYQKSSHIVSVVWFNADAPVRVPGGYQWYKLSKVRLLDAIERQKGELLRRTFEELIGAPVDLVLMPRTTNPLPKPDDTFVATFYAQRAKILSPIGGSYVLASGSFVDRYFLSQILRSRNDKLLFINAYQSGRYEPDKLDQLVKGYFYWSSVSDTVNVDVRVSHSDYYSAAERLGRIVEGMGIKVFDVSVYDNNTDKRDCTIGFGEKQAYEADMLARHFGCHKQAREGKPYTQGIIVFFVGSKLGTLYR